MDGWLDGWLAWYKIQSFCHPYKNFFMPVEQDIKILLLQFAQIKIQNMRIAEITLLFESKIFG